MRKTFFNLVSVVGGEALLRVANFAAVVVIARRYLPETLGLYATALAYVGIATMVADNGLQISAVQEVTRGAQNVSAAVSRLYVAKTLLFVAMAAILVAIAFAIHLPGYAWLVGILTAVRLVVQSYCQLQLAILKTLDRMRIIGAVQAIHFTVLSAGIAWIYLSHKPFEFLLAWFIVGQSLELTLSASVLLRAGIRAARVRMAECLDLVKRSTAVGFSYALGTLILRTDVVVLSIVAPIAVVGHFAAAQVVITMVYVVSWLFGSVILPEMTRRAHEHNSVDAYVSRWTKVLVACTVPATALGVLLTPWALRLLYGPKYEATGSLTAIMLLAVPLILLNSLNFNRAVALELRSVYFGANVATVAVTIVLDFVLGRAFSATGVAAAVVIRETVLLTIYRVAASRTLRVAAQNA